jgi:CubicO group peptidase (beta-lactamase class C family)
MLRPATGRSDSGHASFPAADRLISTALSRKLFPAAVVEVGGLDGPWWCKAFGRLAFEDDAAPTTLDTIFDLASLTKVLATTPLVIEQIERGTLKLDDKIFHHAPGWDGLDRNQATLRDLLSHSSGLPAHAPLYLNCLNINDFERAICSVSLQYPSRTEAIYSDLGFILLGLIISRQIPLTEQFSNLLTRMKVTSPLQYLPPSSWRPRTAPTGTDQWRERLLLGEVHDRNAWALGGVAGHAGLFGTAGAVGACAGELLRTLTKSEGAFDSEMLLAFTTRRQDIPRSSRALGWDTMLPSSSSGKRMSSRGFGHTGFTGTSLWVDPERAIYIVLLTNRVHQIQDGELFREFRPLFHDAVLEAFDSRGERA